MFKVSICGQKGEHLRSATVNLIVQISLSTPRYLQMKRVLKGLEHFLKWLPILIYTEIWQCIG